MYNLVLKITPESTRAMIDILEAKGSTSLNFQNKIVTLPLICFLPKNLSNLKPIYDN